MLSHNVVKDLLPGYIDGICSDETNAEIAEHLADCNECEAVYAAMKEPEPAGDTIPVTKDLDYLKKIRRRNLRRVLTAVLSVIACAVAFVFIFVVGVPVHAEQVHVANASIAEDEALLLSMIGSGSFSVRESVTDVPNFRMITPDGPDLVDRTIVLDVNVVPELFGSGRTYTYNLEDSGMFDFDEVNEFKLIVRMSDKEVYVVRSEIDFGSLMEVKSSTEFPPTPFSYGFSVHEVDRKNGE